MTRVYILAVVSLALISVISCADDDEAEVPGDSSPTGTVPLTPSAVGSGVAPYEGTLGDFLVTPGEADNDLVCDEATVMHLESQLSAAFPGTEVFAEACSAGVALEGGIGLTVLAYRGDLHVPFEAPEDHLEIVEVVDRSAIIAHPEIAQLPARVLVLARAPDDDPGMFIELSLTPQPGSLEDGLSYVEEFLAKLR